MCYAWILECLYLIILDYELWTNP